MRARDLFAVVAVWFRSQTLGLRHTIEALRLACGVALVSLVGIGVAAAEPLAAAVEGKDGKQELVFVTGSRIPQRIQVKAIGTNTMGELRVYTRAEIDRTGRFTAEGILEQDPAVMPRLSATAPTKL